MKRKNKIFNSKWLFIVFIVLNILPVFFTYFTASLDGPQHLYVSNIIAQIIEGNGTFQQFFILNPPIIGNVLGNYIIALLNIFFSAWLSEKLFIILYLVLFVTGFRYLVISINGKAGLVSYLIFPFSYHALFMLGYYNFSLAIALLFFALGYWVRISQHLTKSKLFKLLALFTLIYYAHMFVFAVLLFLIGLTNSIDFISDLINKKPNAFKAFYPKVLFLLASALPGILLSILYIARIPNTSSVRINGTIEERLLALFNMDFLIGYDHKSEAFFTKGYLFLIIIIGIFILTERAILQFRSRISDGPKESEKTIMKDSWLIIFVILFGIYIVAPSFMSIPVRIGLFMILVFILWISVANTSPVIEVITLVTILYLSISLKLIHLQFLVPLDKTIKEIHLCEHALSENTTILTANYENNWIMYHFDNYIGTEKPLINIKSPIVSSLFSVNWNKNTKPFLFVGAKNAAFYAPVENTPFDKTVSIAEYVIIIGYQNFINSKSDEMLKEVLDRDYKNIYVSPSQRIALYKLSISENIYKYKLFIQNSPSAIKNIKDKALDCRIPYKTVLQRDALWLYDQAKVE